MGVVLVQAAEAEGWRRDATPVRPAVLAAGAMIGVGIFLVAGLVASHHAGPAAALSGLAAGVVCLLAALCYAELASIVPAPGSPYAYAYAIGGELPAWILGWSMIFGQVFALAALAVAWSGYAQALLQGLGADGPGLWSAAPFVSDGVELAATGTAVNMPAVFILGAMALLLLSGVAQGGLLHTIIVALGVLVLLVVIAAGAPLVHPELWSPLLAPGPLVPRGLPARTGLAGVATGAALLVIAFAGFERVWAVPRAPRSAGRDPPLAAFAAITICGLLYALATLVMTGLAGAAALAEPAPLAGVLAATPGVRWLHQPVNLALTIVLASAVLGLLQAQGRLLQVMARDGLLPLAFTRIHPHTRALTVATVLPALLAALAAALLPPWTLVALASAPVLLVLSLACAGVILLRLRDPRLPRGFRTPVWWLTAPVGLLACLFLAYSLGKPTLLRLGLWLLLGVLLYFVYGYWRSRHHPQRPPEQDEA